VPRTVKASVRAVFADIVATEPALIREAILKGLRAAPPKSFAYLQLCAAYVDGKPADNLQVVRNFGQFTDDELADLGSLLARATGEAGDE
jgi:cystathionine beta-lyase family protein involved in aluminum resistance